MINLRHLRLLLKLSRVIRNFSKDLRYGDFLGGTIKTNFANDGAYDIAKSSYDDLAKIHTLFSIHKYSTYIDVGCGKGRVLNFWLSYLPKSKDIFGIEIDPEVASRTKNRLTKYKNVSVIQCNFLTADLDIKSPLVYFLYNPFDNEMLRKVTKKIKGSKSSSGGLLTYKNCKHKAVIYENFSKQSIRSQIIGKHEVLIVEL